MSFHFNISYNYCTSGLIAVLIIPLPLFNSYDAMNAFSSLKYLSYTFKDII